MEEMIKRVLEPLTRIPDKMFMAIHKQPYTSFCVLVLFIVDVFLWGDVIKVIYGGEAVLVFSASGLFILLGLAWMLFIQELAEELAK